MSAKQKSSQKNNSVDPYLGPNKDPELEKKVDAMLDIEQPDQPAVSDTAPELDAPRVILPTPKSSKTNISVTHYDDAPPEPVTPIAAVPESEIGGAPLLPSDKLPDLNKKPAIDSEPKAEPETESTPPEEPELEPFEPETEPEPVDTPTVAPDVPEMQLAREREPLPKPVAPPTNTKDDLGLEDASTDRAVDEIVAAEADELLVARDNTMANRQASTTAKPKRKKRIPKFVIILLLLLVLGGLGAAAAFPESRYYALNTAGVRSAASVSVLDETTGQPLKNVEFSVAGVTAKTDSEGHARVEQVKQGATTMTIKKPAFAEFSQPVTLGWGSNPLGEYRIKAVGSQYKFVVVDFLSKKPIAKAEVTSGQANARSNDKGEVVLTVPQAESEDIGVQFNAAEYRSEKVALTGVQKESRTIELTPSRKHVFISKRAGTFDVYKIDVDGKNEEKVLTGTGKERSEAIALSTHPTKNIAVLVSNRDAGEAGKASPSTLTLLNLDDNSNSVVIKSERVQLVDWIGNKLIYVKIAENQTEDSPNRHRLVSYDTTAKSERELASSNYFNDVVVANGSIYYSPAMYQVNGAVGLYKINADGNVKKTVVDKEVWNIFRTSYAKLSVSIGQEWFDLDIATDGMTKASGPPAMLKSRVYFDSPSASSSLWVDDRDGKGVLLSFDQTKKDDAVLLSQSGLKNPVRWLDETHVIYRVNSSQESADYIFNTQGGQPKKIRDVTDTAGIDRWYYY